MLAVLEFASGRVDRGGALKSTLLNLFMNISRGSDILDKGLNALTPYPEKYSHDPH